MDFKKIATMLGLCAAAVISQLLQTIVMKETIEEEVSSQLDERNGSEEDEES